MCGAVCGAVCGGAVCGAKCAARCVAPCAVRREGPYSAGARSGRCGAQPAAWTREQVRRAFIARRAHGVGAHADLRVGAVDNPRGWRVGAEPLQRLIVLQEVGAKAVGCRARRRRGEAWEGRRPDAVGLVEPL
eukprot:6558450-Prymnesium_polylepis.1